MRHEAKAILKNTSVNVHPDEFAILSLDLDHWAKLLEDQSLGPNGKAPFMIFSDPYEVTLLLNRPDFERVRHAIDDSRVEMSFRLLTFTTELDFAVVGFLAEVSRILAEANISICVLSSFSRDHLLVRQDDLARALNALGPHVEELC
ncbi:MAG: ACT domain-containing protein [Acidobacteria bacterium]|nr:ACT domain-containing protein [Acidobacteriota bacterium]